MSSLKTGGWLVCLLVLLLSSPVWAAPPVFSQGPDLGTWYIGQVDQPLWATGGSGTDYTWEVISGALPSGVSLRTDASGGAKATLAGIATTAGVYTFTLRVTSGGESATQDCTLTITSRPVLSLAESIVPDALVNADYPPFTLTPRGNVGGVTWGGVSGLPPGMNMSADGVLSGTPTYSGYYYISFSMNDGTGPVYTSVSLRVYDVLITTPSFLPNATVGTPYTATIAVAGGTAPYELSLSCPTCLPAGLNFDAATGVISGTPQSAGNYSFGRVTVTDANHVSHFRDLSLNVSRTPPILLEIWDAGHPDRCAVGVYCYNYYSVSGGTAPYTWSVSAPPGMYQRRYDYSEFYVLVGGYLEATGTYDVTVTVTDALGASTSNTFPVNVGPLHQSQYLPTGTINVPYAGSVRVLGGPSRPLVPGAAVAPATLYTAALVAGRLPLGLTFNPADFTITGTPLESLNYYCSSFTLRFTDLDGNTLDQSQCLLVGGAPGTTISVQSHWDLGTTNVDSSFSRTLFACCVPSYAWSVVDGWDLPPGLSLSAAGVLSGVSTTVGTYDFLVQVEDATFSGNYARQLFRLVVTATSAPVFTFSGSSTLPYGNVGSLYNQALLVSGGTGTLTWTLSNPYDPLPPGVLLSSTGVLSGTPTATGLFNVSLRVTDEAGHSSSRIYSVSIYASGVTPPIDLSSGLTLAFNIGPVDQPLWATGGSGTDYAWEVISGALPPGVSLRTDASGGAKATLAGVATTAGVYTFRLRVTSGGESATQECTLTITSRPAPALYLPDGRAPDALVNADYPPFTLTPRGNVGAVTWGAVSGLPPGMSLSNDGVLSGTPTYSGSYYISFSMNDGTGPVNTGVSVGVYDVLITTPSLLPNATAGTPYSATITVAGGTAPYVFSLSCPTCLAGLNFNAATGVISGIPQSVGNYSSYVTVTDANHVSHSRYLSLNVSRTPPALLEVSVGSHTDRCAVGVYCYSYYAVSGGTAPYTWSVSPPPGMYQRRYYRDSDFSVLVDGYLEATGTYDVTVTVTDALGASTSNTFPVIVGSLYQSQYPPDGTINVPYAGNVRVLGGPSRPLVPGAAVAPATLYTAALVAGRLPLGLTFNPADFTITGTPLENGYSSFTFRFTDLDGNTLDQSDSIWVQGAPGTTISVQSSWDLGTTNVGSSFSRTLSACCVPSYAWSVVGGDLPPGLSLSAAGVLSGVSTTIGTYDFLVQVQDATFSGNYARRLFRLVVTATSVPVITFSGPSTLPYGNIGSPYSQTLLASGGTGTLTWTLSNPYDPLPPGVLLSSTGVLSGTPTATGLFNVSLRVTDEAGRSSSRTYSVSIYASGATPPLDFSFGPALTFNIGSVTQQLTASGGTPPYHYSLTPGATAVPGMRVQDGPPLPTGYAAGAGGYLGVLTAGGVFNTSIRVTDSLGSTLDRAVTITVPTVTTLSQSSVPKATVGTFYAFTLTPYGGSGNYSFALASGSSLPAGLSLSSDGHITGTPSSAGSYSFSIVLTDLTTSSAITQSFSLIVDPFAITTGGVLPQGVVGTPYSVALSAPDCAGTCTWTWSAGTSYFGLSLSPAGLISGTPTGSTSTTLTLTVSGTNGTVSKVFSLQLMSVLQPLTVTSSVVRTTVGSLFSLRLNATGGQPPYAWSLRPGDVLPGGILLAGPGEELGQSFSPGFTYLAGRAMQVGVQTLTLDVTDAASTTRSATFTVDVSALANQYSSLPVTGNPLIYESAYTQPLLVIGGTGHYTFVNTSPMPPGLTLDANTGIVSGTPSNTGSFSVPMQVDDGAGNLLTTSVTFNVAGPGGTTLGFTTSANLGTRVQGSQASFTMTPTGGTPPYTVTELSPIPPGFALLSGDSLLSGSAAGAFVMTGVPRATGNFAFTLKAQDSAGNIGVRTFSLTVSSLAVVVNTALRDASVGVPYSHTLVGVDNSGPISWSVSSSSSMPSGLGVSSAGVISGTPTQAGTFSFTLAATDSSGAVVTFGFSLRVSSISITGAATLPVATVGVPYTYSFGGSGGGSTLVWSASGLPGGLSLSASGTLDGTPTSFGFFSLAVTATDGVVPVTTRFALSVLSPNATELSFPLTSTALPDVVVGQSIGTITLAPSGGAPPYSWAPAPASTLPPGLQLLLGSALGGTFVPGTTVLAGAPSVAGNYSFDLIATDSAGTQLRRTFTLTVSTIYLLSGSAVTASDGVAYSQRFTAVGGTAPYTFSMTPASLTQEMLPPGLTLSSAGLISGTPTGTGSYAFRLRAQDSIGHSFTRTLSLAVNNSLGLRVTSVNPADTWVGTGRRTLTLSTNGSSTYAWSQIAGSLPPGVGLVATSATTTVLAGAPSAAGVYTFTLRATDKANASNTADHVFTYRVSPMQVVSPPVELNVNTTDLPAGHLGAAYSFAFKMAGGTPPYSFVESPFAPLPPGLSLDTSGVLSGTPQQIGSFPVVPIVSDAAGHTVNVPLMTLVVAPAALPAPLLRGTGTVFDASVGVPYSYALDSALLRGGTPPFSWALAPASALAPGLSILAGSNGVQNYLGGVPTTPGVYTTAVVVTDATGQTLATSLVVNVQPLALTPDALVPGVVGLPYSAALVPSGGVPPYTIQPALTSDMPPGLSLSGDTLSGVPTDPGNFLVALAVSDSASNVLTRYYRITIDNAAGQAPGLSLAPKPVQVYYEVGSPAPAPVPVSVSTTSGALSFNLSVAGIPGATLSSSSGTAPATRNLAFDVTGLATGTYVGVLGADAPGAANLFDATPVTLTVAPAPPCVITVNPTTGSSPAAGGAGSFGISGGPTCGWSAIVSDPAWIALTSASSGTGPATMTYAISPNAGIIARTGSITVSGSVYTITQFGSACAFAITPATLSASAAGGVAAIGITASNAACTWTASGLSVSPAGGTGSAIVNVTVPPNASAATQILTATIADQTLTVVQSGIGCTVGLSPYSASATAAGGAGSVAVTTPAGCSYDTVLGPSWISVTSGASGTSSGTLSYTVDPNSTTVARSGTLTIGGQPFVITQDALACSVTMDTGALGSPYPVGGGSGLVWITANGTNCSWTASSGVPWASLTRASGTGSGSVGVTVTSNAASTSTRTGVLNISGQTVDIAQAGTVCSYALQSSTGSVPASGGSGSVGVTAAAACGWSSSTNDPSWLTITSSGSAGSADVWFTALPNPTQSPRTGSLSIAGRTYSVTQAGAPCSYTLSSSNVAVASEGVASASFGFSTPSAGCSPAAVSYSSWLTITGTAFSAGVGTVDYSVAANPSGNSRVGTIQVGDRTFTVTQGASVCGYSLHTYGAVFRASGGSGNVLGSPSALGCTPAVGTDTPHFIFLGPLSGPISNIFTQPYSVDVYSALTYGLHIGHISFGGTIFTVKQMGY